MAHLNSAATGNAPATASSHLVSSAAPTIRHSRYRLAPPVLLLLGLLAWEWAVAGGRASALFFPAPTTIATTLVRMLVLDDLLLDVALTLYRVGIGLLIGGTAGIILGLLMGWSRRVRTVAEPFVAGLHPIPKSALLPLFLVLMGIGEQPRLALVALAAFFPLLINTMNSVRSIEPAYLEAAGNYGAHGVRLLRRIIVPASLPGMLSGGRIAVNTAMTIAITTELLTSRNGLGARIWMAWETLRTENLYATLIVISVTGLLINLLLVWLERRLMPWSPVTSSLERP